MAGSRSPHPRTYPPASPARPQGVRDALFRTLPGRAIVIGLAIKLLVFVVGAASGAAPAFLSVVDTVAGLAVAAGAAYFLFRLVVLAKRRLLWRVRRKLILSYIFIGFIPAILIVAFFLLCGLLLFYNFSSYLVQTRLHALSEQANYFAQSAALEIQRSGGRDVAGIISRKQANAAAEYPGISLAVVPVDRPCAAAASGGPPSGPSPTRAAAGPWAHVSAPDDIPAWITCSGWSGLLAYTTSAPGAAEAPPQRSPIVVNGRRVNLGEAGADTHILVRAAAFPDSPRPGYAVIVDLLVTNRVKAQLRQETGVELKSVSAASTDKDVKPLVGRGGGEPAPIADGAGAVGTGPPSVSFLELRTSMTNTTESMTAWRRTARSDVPT